jgi:hypothetical protein
MMSELDVSPTRMNLRCGNVSKTLSNKYFRTESVSSAFEKLSGRVSKEPSG